MIGTEEWYYKGETLCNRCAREMEIEERRQYALCGPCRRETGQPIIDYGRDNLGKDVGAPY